MTSLLDEPKGRHTTDLHTHENPEPATTPRPHWRWWPLVGAGFGGIVVAVAVGLIFLGAVVFDVGDADGSYVLVVYAVIIGAIFGVFGGFFAGCAGAVVMWLLVRLGVRSSERLEATVAALVSGVLALPFGVSQIRDQDNTGFGAVLLWIIFPTTLVTVSAAFAARWTWRRGERAQQTAADE